MHNMARALWRMSSARWVQGHVAVVADKVTFLLKWNFSVPAAVAVTGTMAKQRGGKTSVSHLMEFGLNCQRRCLVLMIQAVRWDSTVMGHFVPFCWLCSRGRVASRWVGSVTLLLQLLALLKVGLCCYKVSVHDYSLFKFLIMFFFQVLLRKWLLLFLHSFSFTSLTYHFLKCISRLLNTASVKNKA